MTARPGPITVQSVTVEATGGGCYATLVTLSDERIVITSNIDHTVTICANYEAWENSEYGEEWEDLTTALVALGI